MGRDWYDIIWYGARVPPVKPKEEFLENVPAHTGRDSSGKTRQCQRHSYRSSPVFLMQSIITAKKITIPRMIV